MASSESPPARCPPTVSLRCASAAPVDTRRAPLCARLGSHTSQRALPQTARHIAPAAPRAASASVQLWRRAEAQCPPTKARGRSMLGPRVFTVLSDVGAPRQVRHTLSCRAASCRQLSLRRSKRTDARATPGEPPQAALRSEAGPPEVAPRSSSPRCAPRYCAVLLVGALSSLLCIASSEAHSKQALSTREQHGSVSARATTSSGAPAAALIRAQGRRANGGRAALTHGGALASIRGHAARHASTSVHEHQKAARRKEEGRCAAPEAHAVRRRPDQRRAQIQNLRTAVTLALRVRVVATG